MQCWCNAMFTLSTVKLPFIMEIVSKQSLKCVEVNIVAHALHNNKQCVQCNVDAMCCWLNYIACYLYSFQCQTSNIAAGWGLLFTMFTIQCGCNVSKVKSNSRYPDSNLLHNATFSFFFVLKIRYSRITINPP